jgi:hypothetical protein
LARGNLRNKWCSAQLYSSKSCTFGFMMNFWSRLQTQMYNLNI